MEWSKLVPPDIKSIKFSANDVVEYINSKLEGRKVHVDYDWDNHVVYDVKAGYYYWQLAISHADMNSINLREILFDKNVDVENVIVLNFSTLSGAIEHIIKVTQSVE